MHAHTRPIRRQRGIVAICGVLTYLLTYTTLQAKKKKEEIVTITRRQDAEPLDKRPITMKELFPKEFWRI